MKLDKDRLLKNDPAAIRELEAVIRECVRIGASQVGALEFRDDLAQELMMLVLFKTIHIYDPEREIEPFLIKAAKLAGMAMRRRHGREVLMGGGGGGDEDEGFSSWMGNIADPNHEDAGDRVDRELAEDTADAEAFIASTSLALTEALAQDEGRSLESESPAAEDAATPDAAPSVRPKGKGRGKARKSESESAPASAGPPASSARDWDSLLPHSPAPPKRAAPPRELSPSAARIREIRRAIRYTHKWMANALNIQVSQLHAIEYGVMEPSADLVTTAEALRIKLQKEAPILLSGDMEAIIKSWLDRLGLSDDDYSGFAKEIGVNRSTAFRWLRTIYNPTSDRLWAIELMVQVAERERAELKNSLPKPVA